MLDRLTVSVPGGRRFLAMGEILPSSAPGVSALVLHRVIRHALAEAGHRVLLIDLDPQSSLTISLGLTPGDLKRTVYDLLRDDEASPPLWTR